MYYSSPLEPEAYATPQQYMLGPVLLVAPIAQPRDSTTGTATQWVWLPPQPTSWTPFNASSPVLLGGQNITVTATLSETPLYSPVGAVVPTYSAARASGFGSAARQVDSLEFLVHRPIAAGHGSGWVYEDDGLSNDYLTVITASGEGWEKGAIQSITARQGLEPAVHSKRRIFIYF